MTSDNYPVIEEVPLNPAKRRLFSRRRDASELPMQKPGTVLVFEVDGGYEAFTERRHLTGAEDAVLSAVSVSVVDVRARTVDVELKIPSSNPGSDFFVRVRFECRVVEPEIVVSRRLTNVAAVLAEYLRRDRKLVELGIDHGIEDLNEVRRQVNARVTAYCRLEPPRIPGLAAELSTVDVLTPGELRSFGRKIQTEEFEQKLKALQLTGQKGSAEFLRDLLSAGPEMADAMAIDRGEITAAQVAEQARAEQREQMANALKVLEYLNENGGLNRIGFDPIDLINQVTQKQLGIQPSTPQLVSGDEDSPGFAPNEDDLV